MAFVRDLWTKPNPNATSRTKRIRSARWGKGKRWQAVWVENGKHVTTSCQPKTKLNFTSHAHPLAKPMAPRLLKTNSMSHSKTCGMYGSRQNKDAQKAPKLVTLLRGNTSNPSSETPHVGKLNEQK
ncbi:hypothetical protein [Corynebacterium diphtheriae]|uniref:hypothetical protein n=1 Tax=Corynebacterium diphtheriae TaxID=1717 RepID=UPI002174D52E|nr:hypothetical protein [Corynebacterium diphtheriae]